MAIPAQTLPTIEMAFALNSATMGKWEGVGFAAVDASMLPM
jgi:hypothetical protein